MGRRLSIELGGRRMSSWVDFGNINPRELTGCAVRVTVLGFDRGVTATRLGTSSDFDRGLGARSLFLLALA